MTMEEERFIKAYRFLKSVGRISGVEVSRECNVHECNVSLTLQGKRRIPVSWYVMLCKRGISAEWLLLGKGNMLNNQNTQS